MTIWLRRLRMLLLRPGAVVRRARIEFLVRRAQLAPAPRSAEHWRAVVDAEPRPSAKSLLALGKALVAAREIDDASGVLERGTTLHPDNVHLATNWAQTATLAKDWQESVRRWRHVIDHYDDAPPRAWARWADGLRRTGEPADALVVVDRAIERMGLHRPLVVVAARCHAQLGNSVEEAALWRRLIGGGGDDVPPFGFGSLAHHHRQMGEISEAVRVLEDGLARHPEAGRLLFAHAELAMVQRDWGAAVSRWARYLDVMGDAATLPEMRGGSDWHAGDWVRLAEWLVSREELPSALEHDNVATAVVEVVAGISPATVVDLTSWLAVRRRLTETVLRFEREAKSRCGRASLGRRGEAPSAAVRDVEAAVERVLHEQAPTAIARIHTGVESSLRHELVSARWIDLDDVRAWVASSSPLPWVPEESVRASGIQRHVSRLVAEVAEQIEQTSTVPGDVLREALHLPLWQFALMYAPLQDLADVLASDAARGPVLLPSPSSLRAFDPLDLTAGWSFVLAAQLRARGVPVALVHTHPDDRPEFPPLTIGPGRSLLVGRRPQRRAPRTARAEALFPSGIRSLVEVIEQVDDPLVLTGDAIVSAFAYDRTLVAVVDYRPQSSVLPEPATLAPHELVSPGTTIDVAQARVGTVDPGEVSPAGLAKTVLLPALEETWERSIATVREYQIKRAHVADHLYTGSALFSGAVRHEGGSVTLWPHSTNPVHETVREAGSFDRVVTVLESGAARWHAAHPETKVAVSSDLMLNWDDSATPVDPDMPLNIVVIGGTTTIGLTTFVDPNHHAEANRRLFGHLRGLTDGGGASVWFKSKGGLAEGMWWLEQTIGDAEWVRPMRQHPRRMALPNLVFVAVSLGSSAIYEGIMRGIPGMVARLGEVEDYTTIHDGAIPVRSPDEIGQILARCQDAKYRAALLSSQLDLMAHETGTKAPWSPMEVGLSATGDAADRRAAANGLA